jgi:hypothetical protein
MPGVTLQTTFPGAQLGHFTILPPSDSRITSVAGWAESGIHIRWVALHVAPQAQDSSRWASEA